MKDQLTGLMATISEALVGFGINMEYHEPSAEELEFYEALMFCSEVLARTALIRAELVPVPAEMIEPGDNLQPGDLVPAYNTTADAAADLAFALAARKGNIDLRAVMQQRILQQKAIRRDVYELVKQLTGFEKANLSEYLTGKREMTTGKYEQIINALNNAKAE